MLNELRELVEQYERVREGMGDLTEGEESLDMMASSIVSVVRELLAEPTNVQALALARLIRDFAPNGVNLFTHAFDLPEGYWSVSLAGEHITNFACGIAPDGSVSS